MPLGSSAAAAVARTHEYMKFHREPGDIEVGASVLYGTRRRLRCMALLAGDRHELSPHRGRNMCRRLTLLSSLRTGSTSARLDNDSITVAYLRCPTGRRVLTRGCQPRTLSYSDADTLSCTTPDRDNTSRHPRSRKPHHGAINCPTPPHRPLRVTGVGGPSGSRTPPNRPTSLVMQCDIGATTIGHRRDTGRWWASQACLVPATARARSVLRPHQL